MVVTLVAILLGGLAVASLLRGPSDTPDAAAETPSSSTTATAAPSPSASPSPRPKVDGDFRFLERVGGAPVRWNPCDEIAYAVNTAGASSSIRSDLREALARVTRATGIDFRSVGTTQETFFRAYQRMRFNGVIGRAELIMIWVDHDGYRAILQRLQDPRPSIAFAKTMAGRHGRPGPVLRRDHRDGRGGDRSSRASPIGTRTARSCSTSWATSWAWTT